MIGISRWHGGDCIVCCVLSVGHVCFARTQMHMVMGVGNNSVCGSRVHVCRASVWLVWLVCVVRWCVCICLNECNTNGGNRR